MWEHFQQYREEVKGNPFLQVEQRKTTIVLAKGYEGKVPDSTVELPLQKPLTMEGFENWLFINNIITDVSDYFENKEDRYKKFIPICRVIKRMIRQDQIEGGMAGIYTPSITQRLNGLVERTNTELSGKDGKELSFEITMNIK